MSTHNLCFEQKYEKYQFLCENFHFFFLGEITLAYSRINHEYSSLFIKVINLIFMFSL